MLELLSLLLPLAAASGWYVARQHYLKSPPSRSYPPPVSYYHDLNRLLDHRADKAQRIVEELLAQYPEAIETQIALGIFFRKRGEVHKAISLHEKLLENPNLQEVQRNDAYLELGMDYLKAGLLDRAESIFKALTATTHRIQALYQLLQLYQQERDWFGAMNCTLEIRRLSGTLPGGETEAQFLCELAREADQRSEFDLARDYVTRALKADPTDVRALLLQTEFDWRRGRYADNLPTLMRISEQKIEYFSVILPTLKTCFESLHDLQAYRSYLTQFYARHGLNEAALALCEVIHQTEGGEAAEEYLTGVLLQQSSLDGLTRLLELKKQNGHPLTAADLEFFVQRMRGLYCATIRYACEQCGFEGTSLHWHCPSCRHWSTIKPVRQKIAVR